MASRTRRGELREIYVPIKFAPEQYAPVDYIPEGTIKELKIWIGKSEYRAKRVLARELEARNPRLQLIRWIWERLEIPARQ